MLRLPKKSVRTIWKLPVRTIPTYFAGSLSFITASPFSKENTLALRQRRALVSSQCAISRNSGHMHNTSKYFSTDLSPLLKFQHTKQVNHTILIPRCQQGFKNIVDRKGQFYGSQNNSY